MPGIQRQDIRQFSQQSDHDGGGSMPRDTIRSGQAEPRTPEDGGPCHPRRVSAEMSRDRSTVLVRAASGESLEMPVDVWRDALVLINAIVSREEQAPLPRAEAFGHTEAFGPAPGRVGPGRHGADWSAHETSLLTKGFRSGSSVAALALAHQRTTGAVENQLVKAGAMTPAQRQFGSPRRRTSQGANFGEPE